MKRALGITLMVFVVGIVPPSCFLPAGQETGVAPGGLTVISDAPRASQEFVRFFHLFDQALVRWWENGGRANVRRQWKVLVFEYYDEDMRPRGITVLVVGPESVIRKPMLLYIKQPFTVPLVLKAANEVAKTIATDKEDIK